MKGRNPQSRTSILAMAGGQRVTGNAKWPQQVPLEGAGSCRSFNARRIWPKPQSQPRVKVAFKASLAAAGTIDDTSPPNEAISLTRLELTNPFSTEVMKKTVSISGASTRLLC